MRVLDDYTCITRLSERGAPESVIMATSGHKSVESLKIYNRTTAQQAQQTAALLDDDFADVDQALALASADQLEELEQPGGNIRSLPLAAPAPRLPVNFACANFTGGTLNFFLCQTSK